MEFYTTPSGITSSPYYTATTEIDSDVVIKGSLTIEGINKIMRFNDTGSSHDSTFTDTGNYGAHAYVKKFDSSGKQYIVGDDFATMNEGILTFNSSGTYKIEVTYMATNNWLQYVNNTRHTFGVYISINDQDIITSGPFQFLDLHRKGSAGCFYLRDNNDGVGGSCYLQDYLYLTANDTIRIKTLVDNNDNDHKFEDTVSNDHLNSSVCMTISTIANSNVLQTT